MREYELVIVLRPEMDEPEVMQTVERVKKLVTEKGGTFLKEENWGKRKLAYPIQRVSEGTMRNSMATKTCPVSSHCPPPRIFTRLGCSRLASSVW